jgi:molybdopterin biosynthesis enzyme
VTLADDLDAALRDTEVDAVFGVGGTGSGVGDHAVTTLARAGTLACHGIGLSPGETAAFGKVEQRPVLLIPGRIDAALACWLTLGQPLIAQLSGDEKREFSFLAKLSRKISSNIGLAEVIPVRRDGDTITPLASGMLPLQSLSQADGWVLVPADSEGYPANTAVPVRLLP